MASPGKERRTIEVPTPATQPLIRPEHEPVKEPTQTPTAPKVPVPA